MHHFPSLRLLLESPRTKVIMMTIRALTNWRHPGVVEGKASRRLADLESLAFGRLRHLRSDHALTWIVTQNQKLEVRRGHTTSQTQTTPWKMRRRAASNTRKKTKIWSRLFFEQIRYHRPFLVVPTKHGPATRRTATTSFVEPMLRNARSASRCISRSTKNRLNEFSWP